ncbi:hypothetical protein SLE2022_187840 [Rubroshorea leprosula]
MSNYQEKPKTQQLYDSAPSSHQVVMFMTAAIIGGGLLLLSGLTLTGIVIALVIATPLLVLFSPILVPAGIVTFLVATGFLFSGGLGVAGIAALSWMYNYATGKQPVGSDRLDRAKMMLSNTARDVKEKAKEYGQHGQQKAQEVTQGS